jgi:hypothetical protein
MTNIHTKKIKFGFWCLALLFSTFCISSVASAQNLEFKPLLEKKEKAPKEKKVVPITKFTISEDILFVKVGKKKTLKAKISPANATDKHVKWWSKNPKVATVSDKGVVKGVSKGNAEIWAETSAKAVTCYVTVE